MHNLDLKTCPVCSLFCRNIHHISAETGQIELHEHCPKAYTELQKQTRQKDEVLLSGRPASLPQALQSAGELLRKVRFPLLIISGNVSCEDQYAALELARRIQAVVITPASLGGCAISLAQHRHGRLFATLAELKSRLDCIVTWCCDPHESHPLLWKRLALDDSHVPIFHIEEKNIDGLRETNNGFDIPTGSSLKTFHHLRLVLKSESPIEYSAISCLSKWQRACNGLFLFNSRLAAQGNHTVGEMLNFFQALQPGDHWAGMYLTQQPNDNGVAASTAALTGYSGSYHFHESKSAWLPREWGLEKALHSREPDLILLLGDHVTPHQFIKQPLIKIGGKKPEEPAAVYIPAGSPGFSASGTCLRIDNVPVFLPALFGQELPATANILQQLIREAAI